MFQISGESGSGKTEAAKLTLQYLAAVTSHHRECHAVKYQILQSNPVLEGEGANFQVLELRLPLLVARPKKSSRGFKCSTVI